MTAKEAKDFLVRQTAEQAALENVPLSELEKRMMYFVENDPASCENPLELNEEFEAKYDTEEYEAKIAHLLRHAYERLKAEESEKARYWDAAMRALSDGDHYLPVMWRTSAPIGNQGPGRKDEWKLLGYGLLTVVLMGVALGPILIHNMNFPRQAAEALMAVIAVAVFLLYKYIESRKKSD